ncbi:hypothetical protein SCA6_010898 [Theobroma cacao]
MKSNFDFSNMEYGGGGYALSYSLVEALAPTIDECIERYPHLRVSDQLLSSCLADLGVDLTIEKGFAPGLLSSHIQSPLVTLHHLDGINPLFPSKSRSESMNHLMEAASFDQSRLLQQTICYHRPTNWTFSVSWGCSVHVYENIIPRSVLRSPLETFAPFKKSVRPPLNMFDTRLPSNDPCQTPRLFFLESVKNTESNQVLTTYSRTSRHNLPPCLSSGNHSADPITKIHVVLQATRRQQVGLLYNFCGCILFL